ncbi:ulp1 protease family, C-terminal catalytic domain-containing protein, putative [Eimeria tenella]|uniref:Ulp1 protease family, C-terminal catalytic domain-containing protein, putative n=1 Tax=Eimeria tenella TaxID=5802 RepID=U6L4A6_EIMTE|nr:ulp1 protease family, C-terminal catalytic domain-containing protein, putative [Eimeria tenella]CDJ42610.1 ulp1 protease family, C-terminal catalytic domain-containing protein, putative [Eimeria tenella]|eukprot:XP_013233360.1 ulp1 protease family, C-terminal catalytic domain-containing protein, putative [Eimeria tenella]
MGQRCEIEAHSRLTRWLKKEVTPLPRKDFIFIPVHHKHQHWSLAVVVCPWRALNPTQKSGGEKAVRSAAVNVKCKPEANRSVRDFQLSFSPGMHAQQAGVERPVSSALAEKVAPSPIVQHQAVELPTPLKTQGPHTHRGCRAKARLFYVDSMGLRSVFDRSRGRLKRFLRHEFEHRCGGEMNCGQEVELCTESCCWHDGVSCTLHTPRQQNGYDCGVFVVEYVYFLTRNLNAIETLLLGPSRDFQPQQRSSRDQTPDSTASFVPHNWFVHPGTRVEAVNHGKLLEATLGFYCHCMDVGIPKEMPRVVSSALGLASSLNVHSAEFGQMNTAMHGSAAADVSRQQELRQQAGTPQSPLNTSLAGASFVTRTLTPPPVELVCRSMIPPDAPQLHDQNGLVGDFWRAKDESTTSKLSSAQPESMRHWKAALALQGPLWGPLAPSVSKRRSAHTKWFSQDRVTERRSQLHKMLLFMRQNVLWQEDPKLVAHLKSLFLDIERPCH